MVPKNSELAQRILACCQNEIASMTWENKFEIDSVLSGPIKTSISIVTNSTIISFRMRSKLLSQGRQRLSQVFRIR